MKKNLKRILSALFCVCLLSACGDCGSGGTEAGGGSPSPGSGTPPAGRPLQIVASVFPLWDWTREILGENPGGAALSLLLDSGTDMHSFQPSVDDVVAISGCDLFLYVGGESDRWVEDALSNAINKDMVTVNLLDLLGDAAKEEQPGIDEPGGRETAYDGPGGGETPYDGPGGGETAYDGPGGEGTEYDEHVWLSLKNARLFCAAIADALSELDTDNAAFYQASRAAYTARLDELDGQYESAVRDAPVRTLLFGDRFPFRYLAEDYGLDCYAAFSGCSAETEASFETVVFLARKADELNLPAVLAIDGGDGKLARTIVNNTAGKTAAVLQLDSMQSVTAAEAAGGETYIGVMERNLDVMRAALGLS